MAHQPVSMSELFPPQEQKKPKVNTSYFTPDANHEVTLSKRTEWFAVMFMLPFPFFSAGCCIPQAKCIDVVLNMQKETLRISEWRPFYMCCPRSTEWTFADIATFGYTVVVQRSKHGKISTYRAYIVLKDATFYEICQPSRGLSELGDTILGLHKLIFSRNGAVCPYEAPTLSSLQFTNPNPPWLP